MSRLRVAKILNAHGIKGFVKIRIFADDISLIEDETVVLYTSETENNTIQVKLKNPIKGDYIASVEGVNDRNAAELLRHKNIYINEAALPDLDEDEVYHKDLEGLDVLTTDKSPFGKLISVQNFGAEDLLEIKPNAGKMFYLPLRDEFIDDINVDDGHIIIQDYEDFLE